MTRPKQIGLGLATIGLLTIGTIQAQEPSIGKRIGEKLDAAGSTIRRDAERAGDAVKEQFHKVKASINAMGVEGRVYGRLHWDKSLEEATIEVHVERDGTVTLTGSVPGEAARTKAVTLTTETIGVAKVVDQLAVPTKP